MQTWIEPTPQTLAVAIADWLVDQVRNAVAARGRFAISLAGGGTPKLLYETLAKAPYAGDMPWKAVHVFFGDERFVPPDHPDSNARMVREALLDHIAIPSENVHAMPTDGKPEAAAQRYEAELRAFYGAPSLDPKQPLFDVVFLGVGADGHTASLFPGAKALDEHTAWTVAVTDAKPEPRLTLTYPVLGSTRTLGFIVTGTEKRDIVAHVRAGGSQYPAARVQPHGEVIWFLDRAAA